MSDCLMPGMEVNEFLIQVHQRFPRIVKVLITGQKDFKAILSQARQCMN